MRQRFLAWNESHLAGLDLRDATTNLGNLSLGDIRWGVVGKALDKTISEFGSLGCGKLLRFFKDFGDSLSHEMRIQAARICRKALQKDETKSEHYPGKPPPRRAPKPELRHEGSSNSVLHLGQRARRTAVIGPATAESTPLAVAGCAQSDIFFLDFTPRLGVAPAGESASRRPLARVVGESMAARKAPSRCQSSRPSRARVRPV